MITLIESRSNDGRVLELCPCCHHYYAVSEPHGKLESGLFVCPVCFYVCKREGVEDPRQTVKCTSCACNELYDGYCAERAGRPMIECSLAREELLHDFNCWLADGTPNEEIEEEV